MRAAASLRVNNPLRGVGHSRWSKALKSRAAPDEEDESGLPRSSTEAGATQRQESNGRRKSFRLPRVGKALKVVNKAYGRMWHEIRLQGPGDDR